MGAPIDLNLMRNDGKKLSELNKEVNGIQHILKRLIKNFNSEDEQLVKNDLSQKFKKRLESAKKKESSEMNKRIDTLYAAFRKQQRKENVS